MKNLLKTGRRGWCLASLCGLAAAFSSTSHRAMVLSPAQQVVSLSPLPDTPTTPMFSFSVADRRRGWGSA